MWNVIFVERIEHVLTIPLCCVLSNFWAQSLFTHVKDLLKNAKIRDYKNYFNFNLIVKK